MKSKRYLTSRTVVYNHIGQIKFVRAFSLRGRLRLSSRPLFSEE